MRFKWVFDKDHPQKIKYFVKELGISKALLAKIKFQGGRIEVNGIEKNVLYFLEKQDELDKQLAKYNVNNKFEI